MAAKIIPYTVSKFTVSVIVYGLIFFNRFVLAIKGKAVPITARMLRKK
jgi:uncharacterized membrane protein YjjP (DUF1212 family)